MWRPSLLGWRPLLLETKQKEKEERSNIVCFFWRHVSKSHRLLPRFWYPTSTRAMSPQKSSGGNVFRSNSIYAEMVTGFGCSQPVHFRSIWVEPHPDCDTTISATLLVIENPQELRVKRVARIWVPVDLPALANPTHLIHRV